MAGYIIRWIRWQYGIYVHPFTFLLGVISTVQETRRVTSIYVGPFRFCVCYYFLTDEEAQAIRG